MLLWTRNRSNGHEGDPYTYKRMQMNETRRRYLPWIFLGTCLLLSDTAIGFILKSNFRQRGPFVKSLKFDSSAVPPSYFFATYEFDENFNPELREEKSQLLSIKSSQLAGMKTLSDQTHICVKIGNSNLVAVTGETGSGKSLLFAKVASLLAGGKAVPSLIDADREAIVEMEFLLREPHISAVSNTLESIGIDPDTVFNADMTDCGSGHVKLTRVLSLQSSKRLKNTCMLNGKSVTLKTLAAVTSQLITVVDAGVAAGALTKPSARMAILDTSVSSKVKRSAQLAARNYRKARAERERLEAELESRVLPSSFSAGMEKDVDMLTHWIEELDVFSTKLEKFREMVANSDAPTSSSLGATMASLTKSAWQENVSSDPKVFSSGLLRCLTDVRNSIRSLDEQIVATNAAIESLSSMSIPESATVALEQARARLLEATGGESSESKISKASETAHELLNNVEEALSMSTRFLESDILLKLEAERDACPCSIEVIEELFGEWSTLARKHGIPHSTLPACHLALRSERDGSVEALELLPKALVAENETLHCFKDACSELTRERLVSAEKLAESVTSRLPALGMDGMSFVVDLNPSARSCDALSSFSAGIVGTDAVELYLVKPDQGEDITLGNPVYECASSGEKARILLATECALPGSVGASCGGLSSDMANGNGSIPPVAVIYDEIDAHVGGHAAVAVANMLVEQSRLSSQVLCITHSPSVAAVADRHYVVASSPKDGETVEVSDLVGSQRRKELARMASGNLATAEAEAFANALLRDGAKARQMRSAP